ncbi:MAG: HAD-IIIA family hydrolase [Patescibacteria group bacterium]
MRAVILAGGRGTRLGELTRDTPKSLVLIGGKTILEHQILLLKRYGIIDITLLLGYQASSIREYCNDGLQWGASISYLTEDEPQGTAGALRALHDKMREDFLLLSGDIMLDVNIPRFQKWHQQHANATLTVLGHPTDHMHDSDLVERDMSGKIAALYSRPRDAGMLVGNFSVGSVYIISPKIFSYIPVKGFADLEKNVFPSILANGGEIYAYHSAEYLKDIGTPERLREAERDCAAGKISRMNSEYPRPAIFLDRDGVINKEIGGVTRPEDCDVYPEAVEAIRRINDTEYLAILVTNQPVIAKGLVTNVVARQINIKIENTLGAVGAKLDAIYMCPHYPEKGFPGEVEGLKVSCECRKPGIGMIELAVKDFNIDLSRSVLIGDSTIDAKTAERAGIAFVGVKTGYSCKDEREVLLREYPHYTDVKEAVEAVCSGSLIFS